MDYKVTLICPTFNRPFLLKRSIKYWSGKSIKVIYIDGSDKPLKNKKSFAENISYFYKPNSVKNRILSVIKKIDTPYVSLICDDEFLIPSAVNKCIEFLQHNKDYVSCMGRAIGFRSYKNEVYFIEIYSRLKNLDLYANSSFKRLIQHFSKYVPLNCYAICRSEVFKKSITSAFTFDSDVFGMGELLYEFLVVFSGKTKVLPVLYWLRSFDVQPIRNNGEDELNTQNLLRFMWLDKSSKNRDKKEKLCKDISQLVESKLTSKEINLILDKFIDDEMTNEKKLTNKKLRTNYFKRLLEIIYCKFIPSFVKELWRVSVWKSRKHKTLTSLRKEKVNINKNELNECVEKIKEL